jgi:ComF family protein
MSQPAAPTSWAARLGGAARALGLGVLDLLYPRVCWACAASMPTTAAAFCDPCRAALTHTPFSSCPRCAANVGPHTNTDNGCPHCRGEHFAFAAAVRLGPYDNLLKESILRMKNQAGEGLAEVLGELFAAHAEGDLRRLAADLVVPVPLHWRRRWARGYNQSEAVAYALAERLRLPCLPRGMCRWRHTPMQHHQSSPTARRLNVKGAFRARPGAGFQGRTVLLVDDVMTTGSTMHEAAHTLKAAGAARVVVAVLARVGT